MQLRDVAGGIEKVSCWIFDLEEVRSPGGL